VTESDLKDCETRLQVRLGIELSAFLLNRNGGRPSPVYYLHPTKRDPYAVHWFLPATIATFNQPSTAQPHGGNIESYTPVLNNAGKGQEFLPFAVDGEFHCIAIGSKARRAGKVYFLSSSPKLVAETPAEFLSWIGKPSWA
jgi:SMI1 / KNR4 family (SUKH-1)